MLPRIYRFKQVICVKITSRTRFTKEPFEILNIEGLKIVVIGEIPRIYIEEDFNNFLSIQKGNLQIDKILEYKCLILEFDEIIVLLNGCCHSGLLNTLDYIKKYSNKPISHIIGDFHMTGASDKRINITLEYLNSLEILKNILYLFPIHCSGEKFRQIAKDYESAGIKCYYVSVGTKFNF